MLYELARLDRSIHIYLYALSTPNVRTFPACIYLTRIMPHLAPYYRVSVGYLVQIHLTTTSYNYPLNPHDVMFAYLVTCPRIAHCSSAAGSECICVLPQAYTRLQRHTL
jgi:hypothetical protein